MERFDIEQPAQQQQQRQSQSEFGWPSRRKLANGNGLIVLRKFTAAICLIEALAIVLLVYLLIKLPATNWRERQFGQGTISHSSAPYITYSNHVQSARLLLGPAPNCTQRKHDLAHSVRCSSYLAPGECRPVEDVISDQTQFSRDKFYIYVVETTRSGKRLAIRGINPEERTLCETGGPSCDHSRIATRMIIHPERRHQEIIGWGGALSDSTINNMLSLTTNATRNLLDDYFGPDGLRFNMARVTIGGSDFSSRFYTNDDLNEYLQDDWQLKRFNLMEEDLLYKIPMLRFIQKEYFGSNLYADKLKVFASMWSPPTWLKTNGHFNKGHLRGSDTEEPLLGGGGGGGKTHGANDTVRNLAYAALASLKIKFMEAYEEAGIPFWGLTVMNEPIFAIQPFLNFNTMIFPREDYATYVSKHLGPRLKEHAKLSNVKLMVHDDNRRFLTNYTLPLLRSEQVHKFIGGVSVHGYIDEEYKQMADIYKEFHVRDKWGQENQLFVLPTELCSGHLPFMQKALAGNWHRGVHYALDIIRSLQAMAAGWVDWNMALDMKGGPGWLGGRLDSPILVDKVRDEYHRNPMFYALAHFSRYIPSGSRRLELELANAKYDAHFEAVAFQTFDGPHLRTFDGRNNVVIVIVNNNVYPIDVHWRLAGSLGDPGKFYVTQAPAESIQTIIFKHSFPPTNLMMNT